MSDETPQRGVEISRLIALAGDLNDDLATKGVKRVLDSHGVSSVAGKLLHASINDAGLTDKLNDLALARSDPAFSAVAQFSKVIAANSPQEREIATVAHSIAHSNGLTGELRKKVAELGAFMAQDALVSAGIGMDFQTALRRAAEGITGFRKAHDEWITTVAPTIAFIPSRRPSRPWNCEEDEENVDEAGVLDTLRPLPQPQSKHLYVPRRRGRPKGSFLRTPERVLMAYAELYASGDYVTQEALANALNVTVRTLQTWLSDEGMGLGWPPSRRT